MEGSQVSLLSWFRAIESEITNPRASVVEIAAATEVRRQGTIRVMLMKIRQALGSPHRTRLLAGLDQVLLTS
jgi:hypothetical protein